MSMPATTIAANFHESLDIEVMLLPELTLNMKLPVNKLSDAIYLTLSKVIRLNFGVDTGPSQKLPAQTRTNSVDILQ